MRRKISPLQGMTLEEAKEFQQLQINASFQAASNALISGYPEGERLTWPTQQSEALAWQKDTNSPTPYLDSLAASRGITQEEMRTKTLDQTLAFLNASSDAVGLRQKLRDQISACTTIEEIELIQWPKQ